jgi:hypothetical protein
MLLDFFLQFSFQFAKQPFSMYIDDMEFEFLQLGYGFRSFLAFQLGYVVTYCGLFPLLCLFAGTCVFAFQITSFAMLGSPTSQMNQINTTRVKTRKTRSELLQEQLLDLLKERQMWIVLSRFRGLLFCGSYYFLHRKYYLPDMPSE